MKTYKLERICQDKKLINSKVSSHVSVMQEGLLESN